MKLHARRESAESKKKRYASFFFLYALQWFRRGNSALEETKNISLNGMTALQAISLIGTEDRNLK
ncbi:MAG: hypothetical protein IJG05_00510, partial [Solobacterium sp.]|nr:hypothetical protein [Solobacterium sp.]